MNSVVIVFYVVGLTAAVLLVTRVVRARGGPRGSVHDRYEAAFLNGGPARVVDTALVGLQADGRLVIGGPGIVGVSRGAVARDPVERVMLQEHAVAPHGALHHLRLAAMRHPAVQEIGDGLAERGLVVNPATRRTTRRWALAFGLTTLLLFPVTGLLSVMEYAAAGPTVPFVVKVLPLLLGCGVVALVCGVASSGWVTTAGRGALLAYEREHAHLTDAGHRVALYGLRALPDPVLAAQLLAAARVFGRPGRGRRPLPPPHLSPSSSSSTTSAAAVVTVWCAANSFCGSGGGGGGGGNSCSGGGGAGCSGSSGGSSCSGSSGGSSCSSSSGGSSCSSSSGGSSCSSSSG